MATVDASEDLRPSITTLVDLNDTILAQLHNYFTTVDKVLDSTRSLSTRFQTLNEVLSSPQAQVSILNLSTEVVVHLESLLKTTIHHASVFQTFLAEQIATTHAHRLKRRWKALRSMSQGKDVEQVLRRLHENIDQILLFLKPQNQMSETQATSARLHLQVSNVQVNQDSSLHIGDIRHEAPRPRQLLARTGKCGLCLGSSPKIDESLFHGRAGDLVQMAAYLTPTETSLTRRCLVLGGIGGIGKTQLALKYAEQYQDTYDSIFWLNATSKATLHVSFRDIARVAFHNQDLHMIEFKQIYNAVQQYLSNSDNHRWLLIYDNYDDPAEYEIEKYYPVASHGAVIVTTRLAAQVNGHRARVEPLEDIEDSIAILQTRSQRANAFLDYGARCLAERLAGLPLALATAGAYLEHSSWSFQRYLDEYERRWNVNQRMPVQLPDYSARTLYTTWGLSHAQLQVRNPDAAELLKLLAYFHNQKLRCELLAAGRLEDLPTWLSRLAGDAVEFENLMSMLVHYCFVEVQQTTGTYSIHNCVHDWMLASLNATTDSASFAYAFSCVASSIESDDVEQLSYIKHAELAQHALRLTHRRFMENKAEANILEARYDDTLWVGQLLKEQMLFNAAEQMYMRALAGKEKALGPEHSSTLNTVNNLGGLYTAQGKLDEAEQMYMRALAGKEKALGREHSSTLNTVNNLGLLYRAQGKLDEAEQMYVRALAGKEKALGREHSSTLNTVNNLGLLYRAQGKLDEAEQMYMRALAGKEKALGRDHTSTLDTVNNLGILYRDQGKLGQAEQLYVRALAGYEKALGPEHSSTLNAVNNLGLLYADQGKLGQAEQLYVRALAGYEKALGRDHTSTLLTVNNLGDLYRNQGKLGQAEQMLVRALAGYEKALGPEHSSTLLTVNNLGLLYADQGKLGQAEQMYVRAQAGYEKALGPDHTSTLLTVSNLGNLYKGQGKLGQAEQMLVRALAGFEKVLGRVHPFYLRTLQDLEVLQNEPQAD